ncbi:MAG: aminoacyl-tRNA hydrolase [candidate division WOR-3 bacterium]
MTFAVFGLGNPGRQYERTRHNLGFMVLDRLARDFGVRFRNQGEWSSAHVVLGGIASELVKPMRYMNLSGQVVKDYLTRHPSDFLVVCDDLDLRLGRIRIRTRGSDGGHKGLADIILQLGTMNFPRVRIGIGPKPPGIEAADFVLQRFEPSELETLPRVIEAGRDAVVMAIEEGITQAMNRFNALNLLAPAAETPKSEPAKG